MATLAVSFSCTLRCPALTPTGIFPMGDYFEMSEIAARGILTNLVVNYHLGRQFSAIKNDCLPVSVFTLTEYPVAGR